MKLSQIQKIYLSNFLTGFVFWYGIEKLFMSNIGIDAAGIGLVTAVFLSVTLLLDIPSGIVADRWSRKGMLIVSAVTLALASLLLGMSSGLALYIIGDIFYGLYVVASSGTYQAIVYDSLHEQGRTKEYSKIMGAAFSLLLVGAGIGNFVGGFLAQHIGFRAVFFISIASCLLNVLVLTSLHEPIFHKAEQKEKALAQLGVVARSIAKFKLLQMLVVVLTALSVVDIFMNEFSQLYILRYVSTPQLLGIIWAIGAFGLALGSFIAHRFWARLHFLVLSAVLPCVAMATIDHWVSIIFFFLQTVGSAALVNQIETRIQEATPSAVRASILSVASAMGRLLCIPASLYIGWLAREYGILWSVRFVAAIAVAALVYWSISSYRMRVKSKTVLRSLPIR